MKNTYVFMIVQAMLTLLLFFSEGYVKYATIALFLLIDLILFVNLLTKRWSYEELLVLAAVFCSGIFLVFYSFMKSAITITFGVVLMLLFLVIAMLDFMSQPSTSYATAKYAAAGRGHDDSDTLSLPNEPAYYYDVEYDSGYDMYPEQVKASKSQAKPEAQFKPSSAQPVYTAYTAPDMQQKTVAKTTAPEPVMHVRHEKKSSDVEGKLAAKAVVYELEREAMQLKNAEKLMKDLEVYNAEKELMRETMALEDAEERMNAMTAKTKSSDAAKSKTKIQSKKSQAQSRLSAKELKREAAELMKVQKQINDIQKAKELQKEAKSLEKAEKQVKEIQFLDQQEKIVKQAKAIAKAQKEIDALKVKTAKPSSVKTVVKTSKAKDESFYFSTENGNKFHEPGCMAIKNVPKNKLTLFTSKKEALKKGLQPCSVCIPK